MWYLASLLLLFFARNIDGSKHLLTYDGIVSPRLLKEHTRQVDGRKGNNSFNNNHEIEEIPKSLTKEISSAVGGSILSIWSYLKNDKPVSEGGITIQSHCYEQAYNEGHACTVHHSEEDMSFDIFLRYCFHDYNKEAKDSANNSNDLALSIDATVKTKNTVDLSREILIRSIPAINNVLEFSSDDGPVWTVRSRPSATDVFKKREKNSSSFSNSVNEESSQGKSSIDTIVLSNLYLQHKERIFSTETGSNETNSHSVEVWQYKQAGTMNPTRALFFDSTIRLISCTSAAAHAEAFVHPALIAHPNPSRVAIVSVNPLAYLREILKYKDTDSIEIVGVDFEALNIARTYMPELDDCNFPHGNPETCIENEINYWEGRSVDEWLKARVSALPKVDDNKSDEVLESGDFESADYPQFDVIFIDVPVSSSLEEMRWLSIPFQSKLRQLLAPSSILVINSGNMPSMDQDDNNCESFCKLRNDFLRLASQNELYGGLGYKSIFVYDEPISFPLDSTFMIVFPEYEKAYDRFFRKRPAAIDLEIVSRLYAYSWSPRNQPTVYYDGPTHLSYTRPSRAWENWYCDHSPGKEMPICTAFLPNLFNPSFHHSQTEVRNDPIKGRSLFALEDIPAGHFVIPEDAMYHMFFDITEWDALKHFTANLPDSHMYNQLRDFVIAYGHQAETLGNSGWSVSLANNHSFMNHACSVEEENVRPMDEILKDEIGTNDIGFSPVVTRRAEMASIITVAARDIKEGDEIMINYRAFRDNMQEHPEYEDFLVHDICQEHHGLVPIDSKNITK